MKELYDKDGMKVNEKNHYHYYICYQYSGRVGNVDCFFKKPIDISLLLEVKSDIEKRFTHENVIITFFKEMRCNCEDS